ncbi:thymidylate kinase [Streptomyces sp. NPDC006514]|uniref:dTMP kinase n=1 Tax=Streptomyces sp. NPDC006514 TaxID=3154308 RepID=UPI0033BAF9E7
MNRIALLPEAFQPLPYADGDDLFVDLEGVSGIGKSTLTAKLADRWGGTGIHTLAPPHSGWSDEAHRMRPLPNLAFYLSGLLHVSDRIRRALACGPVIADRYAPSVAACQAAVHGVDPADIDRLLAPFRPYLVVPTQTFYLRCSEETLRERMAVKDDTKQDDADLFGVPGRLKQLAANFETVAATDPTAIVLDTDGLTPDDLADIITAHLETARA